MSQEECARLWESVPYVKVYRYNPKHLYPKLNGYGDNGQRKVRFLAVPRTAPVQLTRYVVPKCAVSKVKSVLQYCWIFMCHVSAWNPKDDYGVNSSVYVVQCNGFMPLIR